MNKIKEKLQQIYPLANNFYIEIFDKNEALLTGEIEITELEKNMLKIKTDEHGITFRGIDIEILSYTADGLRIKGDFNKIEFF